MDDSVVNRVQLTVSGQIDKTPLIPRKVKDGYWSCVDYVDDMDKTVYEYRGDIGGRVNERIPKQELAAKDPRSTLSSRFKRENMANEPREDIHGSCRRYEGRPQAVPCTGDEDHDTNMRGDSAGIKDRWWTGKQTNRGWPGTAEGKINTAQGMAGDLVSNLNSEEKNAVAGILSKTISGAEVVEILAVSTTSVMLNACYDFRMDEDNTFFPYGCVGVGTSLTSVANGHLSAKLAYKVKIGIDCEIAPRMVVYVGGFFHKVLGDSEYYDIPTTHLVNDASPEGRSKNYAKAFFRMAYTGAEIGMRFSL